MGAARSLRRSNPLTLLLGAVVVLGFLFFILSSPGPSQVKSRPKTVSAHMLSPPASPFRKQAPNANGEHTPPPVVRYNLNNLTTGLDPVGHRESILILTPLARFYQEYWDNVLQLSYPHELISLGFIIPKTREGNAATQALQAAIAKTQSGPEKKRFASVIIIRQDFEPPLMSQDESERHKMENQRVRRSSMARARNSLLFTTLGPTTSWVLWLDGDIVETPSTLIEDLASHNRPIIAPNCYQRYYDTNKKEMSVRPYDYNNWIDSATARSLGEKMGPDDILLEGYADMATYRSLMAYMTGGPGADPELEIKLDGVGGTALLVKAEVHRDGAMFPPFAFYHLIETEGFAKMAQRLGWPSYGLPNYFVYHYNE